MALIQVWGSIVPFGVPAWKTNLLSAVLGTATATVLFRLLRVLDVRRTVGAAAALAFALSPTFWTQASIAEVYTLHIQFAAVVTLSIAKWRLGGPDGWLIAGLAVYSLSFGHHLMTVLAAPGIAWLVWSDRHRALTRRNACWLPVFVALAVGPYLSLLYMSDVGGYVEVPLHGFADLWDLVRGGEFKDEMWGFGAFEFLQYRVPLLARWSAPSTCCCRRQSPTASGAACGPCAPGATWRSTCCHSACCRRSSPPISTSSTSRCSSSRCCSPSPCSWDSVLRG